MLRRAVDTLLSRAEQAQIVDAISVAEQHTTGEIKVHVETRCAADPVERARKVFHRLRLHRTADHNAVLIYLAVRDRKFAIVGDSAIAERAPATLWDEIATELRDHFKQGAYLAGLRAAIGRVEAVLKTHFPPAPGGAASGKNVISNRISGR